MLTESSSRRWPGYGAVWRWHFYAGLLCIPFILWLSLTGSIYLFRPQIEAWLDRPYHHLAMSGSPATAAAQAEAAVRSVPGSALHRYQLPDAPDDATQVIVGTGQTETRVYVHPQTLAILNSADEDWRPMQVISRLHGELLSGDIGSYLVELAASWAIVMIISGLFLWWPRDGGVAGLLYPRFGRGGRALWRDLHAVVGFWISIFALGFLLSGLPWAKSWGSYLKTVRSLSAYEAGGLDWTTGRSDVLADRARVDAAARSPADEHAAHRSRLREYRGFDYSPIDRLVAAVRPLSLASPVLIVPPAGPGQPWAARSDAANRPLRAEVALDGFTGRIVSRNDFASRPVVDRAVGYGVAAHEGQLFGLANQLLNLTVAIGLATLAVSGAVMWWRRRPAELLGRRPALSAGLPSLLASSD